MSVEVPSWRAPPSPLRASGTGAAGLGGRIAAACAGWRGPALAALLVLVSALPGLLALPALDRDESRFAEATAQMLETGDAVNIRFQQEPRNRKPVGVYWLQAAAVSLVSSVEDRDIRPYRLPSLLGAMLAAAACAWGAGAAFGPRGGTLAGGVLGAGLLLSSEAFVGKTDAVLCGTVTLAMAALGRLYLADRSGAVTTGRWEKVAFWFGLASAILDKGPVGPMVVGLAILSLAAADRRILWLRSLGWGWGLLLLLTLVGPWVFSITIATDGSFWGGMLGGDIAPKLGGGHEGHAGLPGEHALLAPVLSFPFGFLLPAALVAGWTRRKEPGVRFALAWLIPSWIVFELLPTKLIHYPLPLYGALAWLAAAALTGPAIGPRPRWIGAAVAAAVAAGLAAAALLGATRYGGGSAATFALAGLVAALALASGGLGAWLFWRERPMRALALAGGLGVAAHMAVTGLLLPRLSPLWVSERAALLLDGAGLDPRDGRTVGPVAVAGYAEPSLVFALGADTELDGSGAEAADAVAAGSPAFVERKEDRSFREAVARRGAVAQAAGAVDGFDYSNGGDVRLTLWRPTLLPPPTPDGPTASELEAAAAATDTTTGNTTAPKTIAPPSRIVRKPRRR